MSPALDPMPPPGRANRMMLLVFPWRSWAPSWAPLVTFLGSALVFAGVTYILWLWVFPRLGGRSLPGQVALQAGVSCLIFLVLSVLTTELVVTLLGNAPSMFGTPAGTEKVITITPEMRQMAARLYAILPVVPTVLITLIGYHQYWHRMLSLQHRERELTELAATAQLAALRAQINPHFLFNSLNSIAQLIRTDPDKAEICVERLAEIFRYILRRAEKEFVPLADELEMATAYLA